MPSAQTGSAVTDLLRLAIADPRRTEVEAGRILASAPGPWEESIARQALGIVLRDEGRLEEGFAQLRRSLRLARRSGDPDRVADVRATTGVALVMAGRSAAGLAQLDRAVDGATDPATAARILTRRANVHYFFLQQPRPAVADLEQAVPRLRATDDRVWLARSLNVLGLCYLALGRTAEASRAVGEADDLFVREGQESEAVVTLHNRGFIAYCSGDLPVALRLYDAAAGRYAVIGRDPQKLVSDRSEALLTAGLADEAVELVGARLAAGGLLPVEHAELLLAHATAALADDDPATALLSASRARALFRRQERGWWADHAHLTTLLARHRAGRRGRGLADEARLLAERLQGAGSDQAAEAWLLAGRVGLAAGWEAAPELLHRAAGFRSHPSTLVRATGWRALALERDAAGTGVGVLSACRRGLDALDEHRATLGGSELRALANRHGDELAALALRHTVRSTPRVMLAWSERWRATALGQPPVRPPDDHETARLLAALRDTRRRLEGARAAGDDSVRALDDERGRLELAIRRRARHTGGSHADVARFDLGELLVALDGATFVELVEVDGLIHALVVADGRARRETIGPAGDADELVRVARFGLRQCARGRPVLLDDLARRLQDALLGTLIERIPTASLVLSPTSRTLTAPWGLLPALSDVPFTVVPSAALWLRARQRGAQSTTRSRVLVAGPGLQSGGAEIPVLADRHPDAVVLRAGAATVDACLAALDGAAVAHIAAHGRFREDSPMFSSLELDDGPVTVHDLERLHHAPHRLVLSACESGVVAPIGAGEMLGLATAMLSMGTAGLVSSVAPVNDSATAVVMLDVHQALDDGAGLGEVLLRARSRARGDALRAATAAAFLGMGA